MTHQKSLLGYISLELIDCVSKRLPRKWTNIDSVSIIAKKKCHVIVGEINIKKSYHRINVDHCKRKKTYYKMN